MEPILWLPLPLTVLPKVVKRGNKVTFVYVKRIKAKTGSHRTLVFPEYGITNASNCKCGITPGWKLTLARGELNSVRASGSSDLTSPVGEWEFYGDLSTIS